MTFTAEDAEDAERKKGIGWGEERPSEKGLLGFTPTGSSFFSGSFPIFSYPCHP